MPQEFHILKCYSCNTFQVHIVKKSNKWTCKMCGEVQSIKKVYGVGTAKECRINVQSFNEKRIINESLDENTEKSEVISNILQVDQIINYNSNEDNRESPKTSKWNDYLLVDKSESSEEDSKYTFERPKKRKFPRKNCLSTDSKENSRFKKSRLQFNENKELNEKLRLADGCGNNEMRLKSKCTNVVMSDSGSTTFGTQELTNIITNSDKTQSISAPNTNSKLDISKSTKKSKWSNYIIEENEIENSAAELSSNIFNSGLNCVNLDNILDL